MNDRTRLGTAVLGGYVIGRTKKGGAAVRLAMWLNGTSTGTLTRDGLRRLQGSAEINKLMTQVGQPLMEAARGAAVAAVESRLTGLADGLNRRTTKLLPGAAGEDAESDQQDKDTATKPNHGDGGEQEEAGDDRQQPARQEGREESDEVNSDDGPESEPQAKNSQNGDSDSGGSEDGEEVSSQGPRDSRSGRQMTARKYTARSSQPASSRSEERAK